MKTIRTVQDILKFSLCPKSGDRKTRIASLRRRARMLDRAYRDIKEIAGAFEREIERTLEKLYVESENEDLL